MFSAQGASQDPGSLMLIILIIISGVVFFWRMVIKLAIIGVILLMVLGLSELLRSVH